MSQKMYRPDFSTTKDARVVQTRKALRDALLQLLEDSNIEKISVREIASKAGVGYNTYYRHYPDKESLLEDIVAEEIDHLVLLAVPIFDAEDTLGACHALCGYVMANKASWKILLTGGASVALREEFVRRSREVAESRAGSRDWMPIDIGVVLLTSGIFELLAWWLRQEVPMPIGRVADICQQVIVSPVIDSYST